MSKIIRPNRTERFIAAFSPAMAMKRMRNRLEFSTASDRGLAASQGKTDPSLVPGVSPQKLNRESRVEQRKRMILRGRIEESLEKSPILKSILRDMQTFVPPTGWEPSTDNAEHNNNISEFIADWDCKCDSKGLTSFFAMLGLAEVEKVRGGDIGFAAVNVGGDKRYLTLQPVPGCRIGYPKLSEDDSDAYWPRGFSPTKKTHLHYRNGIEFEVIKGVSGRAVKAHVWKLDIDKVTGDALRLNDENDWVYDTSFRFGKQFWFLSDSLYLADVRGSSDFIQCTDEIESVVRILKSTASRVEFFSKLAGILKGGSGDIGELPGAAMNFTEDDSCGCGGRGCEKCGPTEIKMGEYLQVWALADGKDFDPSTFDLNADMLLAITNALLESAAFATHLPPSFVNLRGGQATQGTAERSSLEKAQREFMRRRRILIKQVARPIIQAALLHGHAAGDARLAGIPRGELLKGDFISPPDVSVDSGRDGKQLLAERNAGLIPDTLYHAKFERSPRRIRALKNQELEQHLEDVRLHSGKTDWSPSPEYVAAFLRSSTNQMDVNITTPGDELGDIGGANNAPRP
jgi:hypothetical protein